LRGARGVLNHNILFINYLLFNYSKSPESKEVIFLLVAISIPVLSNSGE